MSLAKWVQQRNQHNSQLLIEKTKPLTPCLASNCSVSKPWLPGQVHITNKNDSLSPGPYTGLVALVLLDARFSPAFSKYPKNTGDCYYLYVKLHFQTQSVPLHKCWNSVLIIVPINKTQTRKHSPWASQTLWPIAWFKVAYRWWRQGLLKRNNSTKNDRGIFITWECTIFTVFFFNYKRLLLEMNGVKHSLLHEEQTI